MNKFFSNFILLSSFLIFIASIAVYLNYQATNQQSSSQAPAKRLVYQDNQGQLKYAVGDCRQDADCTPAGCSLQFCSSKPKIITTCEIREDFPANKNYQCGCVDQKCAWFK